MKSQRDIKTSDLNIVSLAFVELNLSSIYEDFFKGSMCE